jgi:short chain dehydrogenase
MGLSRRTVVVTGGSKGIGCAVAAQFAASGADVAIVERTAEPLKEAVAAIRKSTQSRDIGVQADVGKAADVQRAYEVLEAFDKVDIVVNNAGTSRAMPFDNLTDEILHDDLGLKPFGEELTGAGSMELSCPYLEQSGRQTQQFGDCSPQNGDLVGRTKVGRREHGRLGPSPTESRNLCRLSPELASTVATRWRGASGVNTMESI